MHTPVLLEETLEVFEDQTLTTFLDCTVGLGGHAAALLHHHPEIETFIACDQDPAALAIASSRLSNWKQKVHLISCNFRQLPFSKLPPMNGILVDLGVSSMQLDTAERGFSFRRDGPLDMRMNPEDLLTAADIVNIWDEQTLGRLFRDLGEETQWRAAARLIVKARRKQPILTTHQLVHALEPLYPPHRRPKKIHFATLIFQALRMAVNHELESLIALLPLAIDKLLPGGRLAVISFHSLEDRVVKQSFQQAASDKVDTSGVAGLFLDKPPAVTLLTRRPIGCTERESAENPRARSAKLRAVEKQ